MAVASGDRIAEVMIVLFVWAGTGKEPAAATGRAGMINARTEKYYHGGI
jgi:hypothetical protein